MHHINSKKYLSSFLLGLLLLAPAASSYGQNWLNNNQNNPMHQNFDEEDQQTRRPPRAKNMGDFQQESDENAGFGRKRWKNSDNGRGDRKRNTKNNVMADIFKNNSEIQTKITQIKEKDPRLLQSFYQGVKTQVKQFKMLMQNKEQEPEIKADLEKLINKELDSLLLSISYREKPDENTQTQIKNTLEEVFVLKETLHNRHIDSIKGRVEQLEEMVAKRKAHKDEIIQIRLSKLTKTKDDLFEW